MSLLLAALLFVPPAFAEASVGKQEAGDLARKCGSEIEWQTSLDEAAEEARRLKRPILWYVHKTARTTMDRKDLVDNYMMMGAWMMPEVIRLVKERFVPLKMVARGEKAEEWGIVRLKFVEPGIVILSHDLKLMHVIDGISTQNEEWLVQLLGAVIDKKYPDKGARRTDARAFMLRRNMKEARAAAKSDLDRGLLELKRGRFSEAEALLKDLPQEEARYYFGAVQFLTGRSDEARKTWRRLFEEEPESRWAWKAEAEYENLGPLVHGFESIPWLPDDVYGKPTRSTNFPRPKKEAGAMVKRAVQWLLQHQKADGAWDDNTYVFGGRDSVPNVHMSVTAIVAAALVEHRNVDSKGVDAALKRAWKYLGDEKNMAPDDRDELIWGYLYRLDAFARRVALEPKKKDEIVKKMNEIVRLIEAQQNGNGSFHHEYTNPFATASVIVALEQARAAGAKDASETIEAAAEWLEQRRAENGTFSYGAGGSGARVQGAAGRMPLCELALLIADRSDVRKLREAIDAGFTHHRRLEAVRKFDDHTDRYRNGGFFFWYDQYGRSLAIERLRGSARAKLREDQRKILFEIGEIDGSWVDSHELGKSYGTAMALLVLKTCLRK